MSISVSYHETASKLQEFAGFARGPFERPEWFELLEKHGSKPLIAVARIGEREAALALQQSEDGLQSLANWFSFAWSSHGRDPALIEAIARDLVTRTHRIELEPVPEENDAAKALEDAFVTAGWRVFAAPCTENHVLHVKRRSFAEYWAARPGKMRTTLKRKARKVSVEVIDRFDEAAWRDYRQVYDNSWKPKEEQAGLLEAFARIEGETGHLRLGIARHEGEPVAAQFWTVEDGAAYIHKLAHVEAAQPLSAGTVLSAALFEHVIDMDGVELVDFGTGNDSYKRDWMEDIRQRYCIVALNPRRLRAWPELARRSARRLASRLGRG